MRKECTRRPTSFRELPCTVTPHDVGAGCATSHGKIGLEFSLRPIFSAIALSVGCGGTGAVTCYPLLFL